MIDATPRLASLLLIGERRPSGRSRSTGISSPRQSRSSARRWLEWREVRPFDASTRIQTSVTARRSPRRRQPCRRTGVPETSAAPAETEDASGDGVRRALPADAGGPSPAPSRHEVPVRTLGHSVDDEYHHGRDRPEGDRDEQRDVGHERALWFAAAGLRRMHELQIAE
jgi:hypothetical protein